MVRLELKEFKFLWGLALLVMFQGQQVEVDKQVKALLAHREKKHTGDSMLQETHDRMSCEVVLPVFESLTKEVFFISNFLTVDLCRELLQVLIYADHIADSRKSLVICLLSQIVRFCPDAFFEKEDFTVAAMELCCKHLVITFQSNDVTSQDCPSGRDLLSELSIVAETIAYRMSHQVHGRHMLNQWKLILAFISICHEWFRGASTDLSLSKVIAFLRSVMPSLKKCVRDEVELGIDDYTHLETVLGAWVSMLAFLSQDCIRRIHIVESKMSDSCKLLAKILAFCLEETVALARLLHETQHLGQNKDHHTLLFFTFKNCTKCIRDTFYDRNIQVQTVGLYVLKSIAQRALAEGSHVKNHFISLFFAGELFGDIFLLIQHSLKEHISRESIAVTEECLRVLFLFHTLSQASECLPAVMMLLLEALLMVFSVSSGNNSQELNEIKTSSRKLVSHLVQVPSSAIQIKDAMLSMPVTRRQQFQDMIRASVTQGQTTMQIKLNVQLEPNVREDYQLHALDFIEPIADRHDIKKEDEDDDEDWDAFQSLPAEDTSVSDSHVDRTRYEATSIGEASTGESDYHHEKYHPHHNLPHLKVSLEISDAQNPETCAGKEMTNLDRNELEEPSDPQHSKDYEIIQNKGNSNGGQVCDPHQPAIDSKMLLEDRSTEENGERMIRCESDADHTIGSSKTSDNKEVIEELCQGVHGVVIISEGDEDGVPKHSGDDAADTEDHAKECEDQLLHQEGGGELRTGGDEDGSLKYSMLAAPENIAKESGDQHLHHEGEGE